MSEQLKPCPNPWCRPLNTRMVKHRGWGITNGEQYWVRCSCGVCGPVKSTRAEAVAAWNTRPVHAALVAALKELRNGHRVGLCNCRDRRNEGGPDRRCDTCKAVDALLEGK